MIPASRSIRAAPALRSLQTAGAGRILNSGNVASNFARAITTSSSSNKPIAATPQDAPGCPMYGNGQSGGDPYPAPHPEMPNEAMRSEEATRPLKDLSTTSLLRALVVQKVSDNEELFKLSSKTILSNLSVIDNGGVMKWVLDQTFYKQFCGGNTAAEVQNTIANLKNLGIRGVILCYAKEVVVEDESIDGKAKEAEEIQQWLEGTLKAIDYASAKDFIALKFSGAGKAAIDLLMKSGSGIAENKALEDAFVQICEYARKKDVRIMIDAECQRLQDGVDNWTLALMKKFNKDPTPFIFNTYQMYRKASPAILASHLQKAASEGFSIGVKLVRGAYLATEPRDTLCATKQETDEQYDFAVYKILTEFSKKCDLGLIVASHNRQSSEMAKKLVDAPENGIRPDQVVFAQLIGMADDLSLNLAQRGCNVLKYVVFGSTAECAQYLLRRAEENREGATRSEESKAELVKELGMRLSFGQWGSVGLRGLG